MKIETMDVFCTNPDCKINETGVCVEGFQDPDSECSYWSDTPIENVDNDAAESSITPTEQNDDIASQVVTLPSGETLNATEANQLLRQYGANVVACVGPSNVGKSTLFASIYENFGEGKIGPFQFGGSRSLYGFERINHDSRISSNREAPDTQHTHRKGSAEFYHLALANGESQRIDLLLADRAGEEYDDASKTEDSFLTLFEVKRADYLLLLIDADDLSDITRRHPAKEKVLQFVKAVRYGKVNLDRISVAIVVTRYDLALEKNAADAVQKEVEDLTKSVKKQFGKDEINIANLIVAARPQRAGTVSNGYGIPELLKFLTSPIKEAESTDNKLSHIESARAFHALRSGV